MAEIETNREANFAGNLKGASIGVKISGLFEAHLRVQDKQASISFYRDILGLELAHVSNERDFAFFWVGDPGEFMLGLWGPDSPDPPISSGLSHTAFRVQGGDVADACNRLLEAGLTPLDLGGVPTKEPVAIGWMPAVAVYFRDPDGNMLEFIEMLNEKPRPDLGVVKLSDWVKK